MFDYCPFGFAGVFRLGDADALRWRRRSRADAGPAGETCERNRHRRMTASLWPGLLSM